MPGDVTRNLGASSSPAATLSGKPSLAAKKSVPGTAGTSPAGGQVSAGHHVFWVVLYGMTPLLGLSLSMPAWIHWAAHHVLK